MNVNIITLAINFNNDKFCKFDIDLALIEGGFSTMADFINDADPDTTLALHFRDTHQVEGPGLRQERSRFINGGRTLLLYRDEVDSIVYEETEE